ncbi:MAG: hypothetical protein ACXQTR_00400 [Candidatus Methanospirareceae archaeon]
MTDASLATIIGRIVILTVVVVAIGFGVVGFVLLFSDDDATVTEQPHPPRTQHPSSSDRSATQPIPTTTPVRPEYNLQKSERDTPIYINYNVDAAEESITDVCSEYKDSLVYMQGETDCNDMAVYLWNMLQKRGVKTLLVLGTTDGEYTPFADCNHVWLACDTPDGYIHIEPTVPMAIYSNCVHTFRTQDEIDAYMESWEEESYRKSRDDYPYLSDEEFDTIWRSVISSEEDQELRRKLISGLRYIRSERPGDYSDFDYRQGYYYAKPSDLRKDLGERW